jgi:hypothetical protein
LRRAWHAVRIHTNAPVLGASASADVPPEHERTSLAVIENQGRMKLYNRRQIEALFAMPPFHKGGWVFRKLLVEFSPKRIQGEINDHVKQIQSTLENSLWRRSMRRMENLPRMRIKNFEPDSNELNMARDVRNFIWLMYGLAPSLSAIIHTHIMGLFYALESEGDLDWDGIMDELKKWAELIGSLSIFMRYVKIRCLHLFALFFLQSLVDDMHPQDSSNKGGKKSEFIPRRRRAPQRRCFASQR